MPPATKTLQEAGSQLPLYTLGRLLLIRYVREEQVGKKQVPLQIRDAALLPLLAVLDTPPPDKASTGDKPDYLAFLLQRRHRGAARQIRRSRGRLETGALYRSKPKQWELCLQEE